MGDIRLNSGYLRTNRGVIKILEIIIGIVISSMLCGTNIGYRRNDGCYNETRLAYCSTLNIIVLIINIIFFIVNLIDFKLYRMERIYTLICTVLFLIGAILMIWFVVDYHHSVIGVPVVATVLIIVMFALFLCDIKIMQGEAWTSHRSGADAVI